MACLCNIAINGLGGCGGIIKPESEPNRRRLENEFMAARDRLYARVAWKALSPLVARSIQRIFLRVVVNEENLVR